MAERGHTTIVIMPPPNNPCLGVALEEDLDGDGLEDALIEDSTCSSWGPPTYYFVAGTLADKFEVHELASQAEPPELEEWNGRPSITITSNNEGFNLDRPQEIKRRFVFEHGRAVKVEEKRRVELKALANLRAEQFQGAKDDEERGISFDLDGDGKKDRLAGTLWERWGRIFWHTSHADGGGAVGGDLACKRIGVLPEITHGVHDLVCDFDTRLRWTGWGYQVVKEVPNP